jgi:hypothetical protein
LQCFDVDVAKQFGGGFASNQWFEYLPRLIDCANRRWSGQDFFAAFSFSPCDGI